MSQKTPSTKAPPPHEGWSLLQKQHRMEAKFQIEGHPVFREARVKIKRSHLLSYETHYTLCSVRGGFWIVLRVLLWWWLIKKIRWQCDLGFGQTVFPQWLILGLRMRFKTKWWLWQGFGQFMMRLPVRRIRRRLHAPSRGRCHRSWNRRPAGCWRTRGRLPWPGPGCFESGERLATSQLFLESIQMTPKIRSIQI